MTHPTPLARRAATGVLTLVLALVGVAACGSDDSSTSTGDTTTTVAVDSTTESSDGDSTTTTAGDDTTTTRPSSSGGGFCGDIARFDAQLDEVDDIYGSDDPEDIARAFASILEPMLAVDAPLPIRDDWATMVDAFQSLARALEGIDFSADDVDAQFEAVGEALEDEFGEIDDAADRVEAFVLSECDIDLSA